MRKVEQAVATIERAPEAGETVQTVADTIISKFRDELGITGGRLYRRRGPVYVLEATLGDAKQVPPRLRAAGQLPAGRRGHRGGRGLHEGRRPAARPLARAAAGRERFAAIEVGEPRSTSSASTSTPACTATTSLFSLGILRHAINQKIRQQRMEGVFRQAREIQTSLLPRRVPVLRQLRSRRQERCRWSRWAATSTITSRSPTRSWGSRSPTSPGTACRRRCRCATSTWACAWAWGATSRSCAPSSG